jgi:glycosyltransferase involved in cell wall biosynthesis
MKVVFINTSDNSGGAAIACLRLRKAMEEYAAVEGRVLVQEKNTTNTFVETISDTAWKKKTTWLRFVAERLSFLPYERSKEIRFLFNRAIFGADISNHPLVQEAQIIHLHWVNFGFLSTSGLKKLLALGKPVVWTFHDMWPFTGGCHHSGACDHYENECGNCKFLNKPSEHDISHGGWKAKKKAYLPSHFTAVACSHWLAGHANRSSLLKGSRIESIPNPIDTSLFHVISKKEARLKLGLPVDKELILFAAMRVHAPGKGFIYFVDALNWLSLNHPEWNDRLELVVFGQADDTTLAGLPYRAHKLGHLSDVQKIILAYNAASMFVTPSLEENLPNTIMESFACGTPAVGFRVGGIPEMIDHKINGFVSEYKSTESLGAGMQWVLDHNTEGTLSNQARQKVLDKYSEKVVAEQYYNLYQSLL